MWVLLVSCTSNLQATHTVTPPPTETPVPTPTLHPQFIFLQNQFFGSKFFSITNEGRIEILNGDGQKFIDDIVVKPDGTIIVTYKDTEYTIDPNTIEIQENILKLKDLEGRIWTWDGDELHKSFTKSDLLGVTSDEKLSVAPEIDGYTKWKVAERFVFYKKEDDTIDLAFDLSTWEQRAIKSYTICKIDKFYNCEIPYEELQNGDYWLWLNTLSKPFDTTKIKDVPMTTRNYMDVTQKTEIIYDPSTAPNFNDPTTRPFRRDVTFGVIYYKYEEFISYGTVMPIEFFDKNDPQNNKWVLTIDSHYYEYHGNVTPSTNQYLQWQIDSWKYFMNITPILTTIYSNLGVQDPLAMSTYENYPDIGNRFQYFIEGDVSMLSAPDIFLLTYTNRRTTSGKNIYK
jgi:hypothetical protein